MIADGVDSGSDAIAILSRLSCHALAPEFSIATPRRYRPFLDDGQHRLAANCWRASPRRQSDYRATVLHYHAYYFVDKWVAAVISAPVAKIGVFQPPVNERQLPGRDLSPPDEARAGLTADGDDAACRSMARRIRRVTPGRLRSHPPSARERRATYHADDSRPMLALYTRSLTGRAPATPPLPSRGGAGTASHDHGHCGALGELAAAVEILPAGEITCEFVEAAMFMRRKMANIILKILSPRLAAPRPIFAMR